MVTPTQAHELINHSIGGYEVQEADGSIRIRA
jgi:hypothetical protein